MLDLHGGPRSALLAWATGAPRRIGYTVTGRGWMYTEQVSRDRVLRPRHSVVNQWDLLTALGCEPPDPERDPTEMVAPAAAVESVARKLASAGVGPVAAPCGRRPRERRQPVPPVAGGVVRGPADGAAPGRPGAGESWSCRDRPSTPPRATSGRRPEAALGPDGAGVIDDVEFDLGELRALMDVAALFIGGDSGPLHVAGTSRVPVVGLYGPTLAARSAPWRPSRCVTESIELSEIPCRPCDQRRCEPGDYRCLGSISPGRVAEAAERALRRAGRYGD